MIEKNPKPKTLTILFNVY